MSVYTNPGRLVVSVVFIVVELLSQVTAFFSLSFQKLLVIEKSSHSICISARRLTASALELSDNQIPYIGPL